jgi:hypothetical protein
MVTSLHDPNFTEHCSGKDKYCSEGWGLRVLDSTDIFVYGAGLYSFFDNNDACITLLVPLYPRVKLTYRSMLGSGLWKELSEIDLQY